MRQQPHLWKQNPTSKKLEERSKELGVKSKEVGENGINYMILFFLFSSLTICSWIFFNPPNS